MQQKLSKPFSPWPHRFAVLLCCATFPLIWVGGLVTTYDAGMAVPDWPGTYGYNLFLYPWSTWFFGPWDLFIEHGHRLLGALVGMITIGLVIACHRADRRPGLRMAAWVALALVLLQGSLGGARVLLDQRTLAMLHGCLGPSFFAYCAGLAVFTSRWWYDAAQKQAYGKGERGAARVRRLAIATALLALGQLFLGAQLRHVTVSTSPSQFSMFVVFHILVAVALVAHVVVLGFAVWRLGDAGRALRRAAAVLASLVMVQVALGSATWVVKYGWPQWFETYRFAALYTVHAESLMQAIVVTLHVATGSLILAAAVVMALRSLRAFPVPRSPATATISKMEYQT